MTNFKSENIFKLLIGLCAVGWMIFGLDTAKAAVNFKAGSFLKATSTGNQAVTGVGFQPSAMIFFWTNQTSTVGNFRPDLSMGIGFATSSSKGFGMSIASDDAVGTSISGRMRSESNAIILLSDGDPTLRAQASLSSMDTDGFTVNWGTNDTATTTIDYIALGGSDITNVNAGTSSISTSAGSQSFTGVGFTPDFMIFTNSGPAINPDATSSNAMLGVGFAASSTQQGAMSITDRDGMPAATTAVVLGTTSSTITHTVTTALDSHMSLTSFDANGFTLNVADAPASALPIHWLAIKGGQHFVGNFAAASSTGNQAIVGPSFQPLGLFMFSHNQTSTANLNGQQPGISSMAFGAVGSATSSRKFIWGQALDGPSNMETNVFSTSSQAFVLATGTSTIEAKADMSSFDSGGFTLNWSAVNADQDKIVYWAVGSSPVPTPAYEQSAYRWFKNQDGTGVGAPLAAQNTSASISTVNTDFRLRILLHVGTVTSTATTTTAFKLQMATSTPNGCDPAYAGETYVDLATSTGNIRFKNNSTPADGALLTANADDPTHGGDSIVNQTYEEENNFTVTSTISAGQDGKWDFALTNASAPLGTTYCFRTVFSSSTLITTSTLTKIPEFTTAANSAPTVSSVSLNNSNAIILTPNATTSIRANFTVTDTDGCDDVFTNGSLKVTVFRSSLGSSCSLNDLNCYSVATSTNNCSGASSANATSTVDIYYFAQATDASSSFASDTWRAFVLATDAGNATGTSSSTAELSTLVAIDVTPASINYGTVSASSTSGSVNQTSTIKNAGNATTTLKISGTALALGVNSIATSSQRYATSSFTVGGNEQQLSGTATDVSGLSIPSPPMGGWKETQALPNALWAMGAAAYNGYVYSIGGTASGLSNSTTSVWYSPIAASGTIGSWTSATALPGAVQLMPAVAYRDYLYTIGGWDGSVETSSVYYAAVNTSTGALGSWLNATALPSPISHNGGAAYNGYLYIVGGGISSITSTVRYALINATGSIGSWTNTTALPGARGRHKTVASDGYIYAIGGVDPTGTSSVVYAPLNADGTVGSWLTANALPGANNRFGAVIASNIIYVVGGNAPTATTTVIFAAQNASGSLGIWSKSPFSLPTAQNDQGLASDRGFMYQLGGAGTTTSTVLYAPIVNRPVSWGISVPAGTATGTYTGQNTFTSVFSP